MASLEKLIDLGIIPTDRNCQEWEVFVYQTKEMLFLAIDDDYQCHYIHQEKFKEIQQAFDNRHCTQLEIPFPS